MNTQELKQYIDRVLGNNIRCLLPSYWWKKLFGEVVDSVSNSIDSVSKSTKSSIDKLSTRVSKVENSSALYVDITYEELRRKKENYELIPGQLYRITDYECTINDNDPDVVVLNKGDYGYREFDIIVEALSEDQLSENASVLNSSTVNGYSTSAAWEIKYTLDNNVDKYTWARLGSKSYDVVVQYSNSDSTRVELLYWDEYSQKYTNKGYEKYIYLVDEFKNPITEGQFNYKDTVYLYYFGNIYESTVLYTDNMKDTGDGVLVNCRASTSYESNYRPFIWDPIEKLYKYNIIKGSNTEYDVLYPDNYGTSSKPIQKKEYFSRKEKFTIRKRAYEFSSLKSVTSFDIAFSETDMDFYTYFANWNSSTNRYSLGTSDEYLGVSETDSTPLQQTDFSIGDTIYLYQGSGEFIGIYTVNYINSSVPDDTIFLLLVEGIAYVACWDYDNEAYYIASTLPVIFKDGTPVNKDFDFSSNIEYGVISVGEGPGSISTDGEAVGFYIPEGKGVIYYMKDQFGNEAHYDFKSILFRIPEIDEKPRFTFHGRTHNNTTGESYNSDASEWSSCSGFSIKPCTKDYNKFNLNKITISTPSSIKDIPKDVTISGEIYNKYLYIDKKSSFVGLDSNGEILIIRSTDLPDSIETLRQEVIDNEEVTAAALNDLNTRKQDVLVDGKNIKTFNGQSLLGEGDFSFIVDTQLDDRSENPVQNKVITEHLNGKYRTFNINNYNKAINLIQFWYITTDDRGFVWQGVITKEEEDGNIATCLATGGYTAHDENGNITVHIEYFSKGKRWERVISSDDTYEDVEIE